VIWNLNLDFNVIRLQTIMESIQLQTIMESIQQMAPKSSPLVALAQQRAEAAILEGNHSSATDQMIG
jgi:hypothetical protein